MNVYDFVQQFKTMLGMDAQSLAVVTGLITNPYKEFSYAIPNNEIVRLQYDHTFMRILSLDNASGFTLRFGQSGTETTVVGGGIGFKHNQPIGIVELINRTGGVVNIRVGLSVGEIFDDRLNVSGTITIANTKASPLWVSAPTSSLYSNSLTVGTSVAIIQNDPLCIAYLIQNTSSTGTLWVGPNGLNAVSKNGIRLLPGESFYIGDLNGLRIDVVADMASTEFKVFGWYKP